MKQDFDLHTHTTYSDGSLTPAELIKRAFGEGIKLIAITDHDNISGIKEALEEGKKFGIKVIPGVEISIDYNAATFHLCGYFIDTSDESLNKKLKFIQNAREERNSKIIGKLNELGIDITMEEVRKVAGSEQIGRPHFAKVLAKRNYAKNSKEAFTRYLAKGKPGYVDRKRLKLDEAVSIIEGAGGVPVIAHPAQVGLKSPNEYKEFFSKLKCAGVVGVEAYSSHHSEKENLLFHFLSNELRMLVTGGSDFHGDMEENVKLGVFGNNVKIDKNELLTKFNKKV
jgi:hypothetical protein